MTLKVARVEELGSDGSSTEPAWGDLASDTRIVVRFERSERYTYRRHDSRAPHPDEAHLFDLESGARIG